MRTRAFVLFVAAASFGCGGASSGTGAESDAQSVAADKASLAIGFAPRDSASSVTQDLALPTQGSHGSSISWSSSALGVVSDAGTTIRPAFGSGDVTVVLTATILRGTANDTRTFTLTVKEAPISDAQSVASDEATLSIGYADGDSATSVTRNVVLPSSGPCGSSISWASTDPTVVSTSGTVIRPSYGQPAASVDLTARISKGAATGTRTFTVTVLPYDTDLLAIPITLASSSHPDPTAWYNDARDWSISWSKPFADVRGYWVLLSTSATGAPTASTGTFLQQESYDVPAADLLAGHNYFHVVPVDPAGTVGTVDNVLSTQINVFPPSVSSSSHPDQATWYLSGNVSLAWTNPQADSNYTGYYYVVDHVAGTMPTAANGTFIPVSQKQLLLALGSGVWVFHIVNIDQEGATTLAAADFTIHIGTGP